MIHRLSRGELYDLVWSQLMQRLAKQFGISDVALAKTCRRAEIPVPKRGYWAKLQAGKKVTRIPLPPRGPGVSDDVFVGGRPSAMRSLNVAVGSSSTFRARAGHFRSYPES